MGDDKVTLYKAFKGRDDYSREDAAFLQGIKPGHFVSLGDAPSPEQIKNSSKVKKLVYFPEAEVSISRSQYQRLVTREEDLIRKMEEQTDKLRKELEAVKKELEAERAEKLTLKSQLDAMMAAAKKDKAKNVPEGATTKREVDEMMAPARDQPQAEIAATMKEMEEIEQGPRVPKSRVERPAKQVARLNKE